MRVGDFNGDKKSDIYFYAQDGEEHIGLSNGSSDFDWTNTDVGLGDPGTWMQVGDFNGDSRSDVFFYFSGDGNHWVGLSERKWHEVGLEPLGNPFMGRCHLAYARRRLQW